MGDGSVARARTLKRREATVRHDLPFLKRLTARPWDPPRSGGPGDGELGPGPLVVVPPMAPGAPAGEPPEHRRVYLTRADLDRHGYTQDCPGCAAAQSGQKPRTHSEGCRARLEEAMTQDELGRDRLLRAALRRAEPTDAVPEGQDVAMEPERPGPAPEQPSGSGLVRVTREDKKRPGGEREETAGPLALPAPQGQASSSGRDDPMLVESVPDHPAEESSAAGKSRGKPKRKPVGAVLLRELQAAEAAAEGSVCAIEIALAMEAADRLCADAVALAEAYSPERFKPRAGAFGLRAGLALDLRDGMGSLSPQAAGGCKGGDPP